MSCVQVIRALSRSEKKTLPLTKSTILSNVVLMVSCNELNNELNKLLIQMKFFQFSSIVPVGFIMSLSKLSQKIGSGAKGWIKRSRRRYE